LDKLLTAVDRIYMLDIIGGETFLVKDLEKMIEYAESKSQVRQIIIITNGTILPSADLLRTLKKTKKTFVFVSDYRNSPSAAKYLKYDEVVKSLSDNGIKFHTPKPDWVWIKRPEIYRGNRPAGLVKYEFDVCENKICVRITDGKMYTCPKGNWIARNTDYKFGKYEQIDIHNDENLRKSIIRFYFQEYYGFCDFCHMTNIEYTQPAEQHSDSDEKHDDI
jgi:hypothetical protein